MRAGSTAGTMRLDGPMMGVVAMGWIRLSVVCVGVAVALGGWLAAVAPASAAYPGANGRIAFLRHGDVYTVQPDGSGLRRLTFTATATADGVDATPVWSPNGQKIAYSSQKAGSRDIWVMNTNGSGKHRVTFSSDWNETDPTWSPDGRWIAFSSDRGSTQPGTFIDRGAIFKIRSTAPYGAPVRLTRPGLSESGEHNIDWAPRWSPLGDTIMFSREFVYGGYPPGYELFTVPSHGGTASRVQTGSYSDAWLGDWAPRARAIAWSSNADSEDGHYYYPPLNIWMRTPDGAIRRLTPADAQVRTRYPAWAPNGTQIAYERWTEDANPPSVWMIKPDGTQAHLVIGGASQPNWQPVIR
jgi:Tol biopolymer transport system component